ncbi:MAG TPA: hypothetical protein VLC09_18220 [Polyangiaceae bacterium]|nr:hypothetical protein [Polyangiaceae bacterium]
MSLEPRPSHPQPSGPGRSPEPRGVQSPAPKRRLSLSRLGVALGVVAWACTSTTETEDKTLVPTAVVVDPVDFLGDHTCAQLPGAVHSYQATLIDISVDLEQPFALASSAVLDCNAAAFFAYVTPGRRYKALVEAFDQPGLKAQTNGLRMVVDDAGEVVAPRYVGYCRGEDGVSYGGASGIGGSGGDDGAGGAFSIEGIYAQTNTRVYVRGCEPLVDSGTLGPTGVSIDVEPFLVGTSCGAGGGQIESFAIEDPSQPSDGTGGAGGAGAGGAGAGGAGGAGPGPSGPTTACGEAATIEGLPPATSVSYSVALYEAGASTPTYRTTCRAFTSAGVIVPASCTPVEAAPSSD